MKIFVAILLLISSFSPLYANTIFYLTKIPNLEIYNKPNKNIQNLNINIVFYGFYYNTMGYCELFETGRVLIALYISFYTNCNVFCARLRNGMNCTGFCCALFKNDTICNVFCALFKTDTYCNGFLCILLNRCWGSFCFGVIL